MNNAKLRVQQRMIKDGIQNKVVYEGTSADPTKKPGAETPSGPSWPQGWKLLHWQKRGHRPTETFCRRPTGIEGQSWNSNIYYTRTEEQILPSSVSWSWNMFYGKLFHIIPPSTGQMYQWNQSNQTLWCTACWELDGFCLSESNSSLIVLSFWYLKVECVEDKIVSWCNDVSLQFWDGVEDIKVNVVSFQCCQLIDYYVGNKINRWVNKWK